tara:strand:- start:3664 stop:3807 length:144 start_codon:yes stop_codon:yes gene_type:complete
MKKRKAKKAKQVKKTPNGKGDAPRNCHSKKFKDNYDNIDWGKKKKSS